MVWAARVPGTRPRPTVGSRTSSAGAGCTPTTTASRRATRASTTLTGTTTGSPARSSEHSLVRESGGGAAGCKSEPLALSEGTYRGSDAIPPPDDPCYRRAAGSALFQRAAERGEEAERPSLAQMLGAL